MSVEESELPDRREHDLVVHQLLDLDEGRFPALLNGVTIAGVSAGSNQVGASEICTAQGIWPSAARTGGAATRRSSNMVNTAERRLMASSLLVVWPGADRGARLLGPVRGLEANSQMIASRDVLSGLGGTDYPSAPPGTRSRRRCRVT